jgi:hypothetical protein
MTDLIDAGNILLLCRDIADDDTAFTLNANATTLPFVHSLSWSKTCHRPRVGAKTFTTLFFPRHKRPGGGCVLIERPRQDIDACSRLTSTNQPTGSPELAKASVLHRYEDCRSRLYI